jgi:hypothetical protein
MAIVTKLDNDICNDLLNTNRPYHIKLVEEDHIYIGRIISAFSVGMEVPDEMITSIRNRYKVLEGEQEKLHKKENTNGRKDKNIL